MRHDQIALQLYTVRTLLAADLTGTLRAVAAAGYKAVELAGLPSMEPAELARLLDAAGLRPVASHEGIASLREDPEAVARRLGAVGCPRVIVPWMPEEDRRTVADVRRFAAEVGRLVPFFADRGISVGYHNHAFEFEALEGTTVWDVLGAELPSEVELELDVYWVSVAGRDPLTELRAAADRVRLLHMKDRSVDLEPRDLPAGEGILDFPSIVAAGRAAGVAWYVAELDNPQDPIADVTTAGRYLETLAS
jgi:sugar phosphate isomerase/epimerase